MFSIAYFRKVQQYAKIRSNEKMMETIERDLYLKRLIGHR